MNFVDMFMSFIRGKGTQCFHQMLRSIKAWQLPGLSLTLTRQTAFLCVHVYKMGTIERFWGGSGEWSAGENVFIYWECHREVRKILAGCFLRAYLVPKVAEAGR